MNTSKYSFTERSQILLPNKLSFASKPNTKIPIKNSVPVQYRRIHFKWQWIQPNTSFFLGRFRLINAVKPHTSKVTMTVMLPDLKLIVTGSEDQTLFFFQFVTNDKGIAMDPIRCVRLDHAAINFEWIGVSYINGIFWYTARSQELWKMRKNLIKMYPDTFPKIKVHMYPDTFLDVLLWKRTF